jgi:multicomponent Na+:H+ antiporter subunit B
MSKRLFTLILLIALAVIAPLVFTIIIKMDVPRALKSLGLYYVKNTINDTASPEAVAAIVWDYRGLDTIYETLVLYLAIVGGLAVFRVKEVALKTKIGLTSFARSSTRIISLLIATISLAIALHGHLTPGGGFPGGSALAVASMIVIPVYSANALIARGITSTRLVAIRGFALTGIGLVAFLPTIRGLEIVTNQAFYPATVLGQLISGSISLYNLFEFLAVMSGFTAVALYLSIPEEVFKVAEGA